MGQSGSNSIIKTKQIRDLLFRKYGIELSGKCTEEFIFEYKKSISSDLPFPDFRKSIFDSIEPFYQFILARTDMPLSKISSRVKQREIKEYCIFLDALSKAIYLLEKKQGSSYSDTIYNMKSIFNSEFDKCMLAAAASDLPENWRPKHYKRIMNKY